MMKSNINLYRLFLMLGFSHRCHNITQWRGRLLSEQILNEKEVFVITSTVFFFFILTFKDADRRDVTVKQLHSFPIPGTSFIERVSSVEMGFTSDSCIPTKYHPEIGFSFKLIQNVLPLRTPLGIYTVN